MKGNILLLGEMIMEKRQNTVIMSRKSAMYRTISRIQLDKLSLGHLQGVITINAVAHFQRCINFQKRK